MRSLGTWLGLINNTGETIAPYEAIKVHIV